MFGLFGGSDKKTDTKKKEAVVDETAATTQAPEQQPTTKAPAAKASEAKASTTATMNKQGINHEQQQQGSGNLLMISNQKHRSFYERAARELLASGHEEIQLSALGNAVPLAVTTALSLQDKNAATLSKIETKHVDFAPAVDGGRRRYTGPAHSSGVSITLRRHPQFKGTRIVPGHIYFSPKPTNDDAKSYHAEPDMVFAALVSGPSDNLFGSAAGKALVEVLKKAGQGIEGHKKLQAHLFQQAKETNAEIHDLKSIKFVGELSSIKEYNPDLKGAFVRVLPQSNDDSMTGAVFVEVFEDGKCPFNNENNAALVHLIAPKGSDYKSANEFLKAVELAAANLMMTLCDFNGYSRRHSGAPPRLRKIAVARLGLFSSDDDMIHSGAKQSDVAKALFKGLDGAYHFGIAPRIQFEYDNEELIKNVWIEESGAEEVQIVENIFRRRRSE